MAAHLRVYRAAETDEYDTAAADPTVRVRLGDLLPLVAAAQKLNFAWLKDFLDDEVAISSDLDDVLRSFRPSRPGA